MISLISNVLLNCSSSAISEDVRRVLRTGMDHGIANKNITTFEHSEVTPGGGVEAHNQPLVIYLFVTCVIIIA